MNMLQKWKEAQYHETRFWLNANYYITGKKAWSKTLKKFGRIIRFQDKIVIEIGCGPHGAIHFLDAKYKIGIDPLLLSFKHKYMTSQKTHYIRAIGEYLPLKKGAVDIIICNNVLDHCIYPELILKETNRVLNNEGLFYLWIHTIKQMFRFILKLPNLDKAHPYRFTRRMIFDILRHAKFKIVNIVDDPFSIDYFSLKTFFAKIFLLNTYIVATKYPYKHVGQ